MILNRYIAQMHVAKKYVANTKWSKKLHGTNKIYLTSKKYTLKTFTGLATSLRNKHIDLIITTGDSVQSSLKENALPIWQLGIKYFVERTLERKGTMKICQNVIL